MGETTMRVALQIPPGEAREADNLLGMEKVVQDARKDGVLMTWTATFQDGCQADLKICNGDAGPWAEAVLFDTDGHEIACSHVDTTIWGEWVLLTGNDGYLLQVHR